MEKKYIDKKREKPKSEEIKGKKNNRRFGKLKALIPVWSEKQANKQNTNMRKTRLI